MTKPSTNNQEHRTQVNSPETRPILQALNGAKTILVPNARAAELVRERYALQMIQDGRNAWPSARILPWRVWLGDYYARTNIDAPGLLSNEQALLVWEQIIGDERDLSLQQVNQFTRLAAEAWANVHLWQIPAAALAQKFPTFEVGLFGKWQKKFIERCRELNVIDTYQAAADLLAAWRDDDDASVLRRGSSQQLLVGYHEPPPLLKSLGRYCWQILSLDVEKPDDVDPPESARVLQAFERDTEELQSAIAWAVELKRERPQAAVAIAISNPGLMRHATRDGLRRYLYQCGDERNRELAAAIGLFEQKSLGQTKLVQSALRVLKLGEQLGCDDATGLLLDPTWTIGA